MNITHEDWLRYKNLEKAMRVITLTPHIMRYLLEHDPAAYHQAMAALGDNMTHRVELPTPSEEHVAAFYQGSRHASSDYDEHDLAWAQNVARKMRRHPTDTPYADGYCVRVGELTRMKEIKE